MESQSNQMAWEVKPGKKKKKRAVPTWSSSFLSQTISQWQGQRCIRKFRVQCKSGVKGKEITEYKCRIHSLNDPRPDSSP